MGTSHNPSCVFLSPFKIILLSLNATNFFESKWISHPSSHNCPRDKSGVLRSSNTQVDFALLERAGDKGNNPICVAWIVESSAKWTVGPLVFFTFKRTSA